MSILRSNTRAIVVGLCLMSIASTVGAQRSSNQFRGFWQGTLSPNIILGAPEEDIERLSQAVEFELRVFNRGRAEIYFRSDNEEWEVTGRDVQITDVGVNGTILTRMSGAADNAQTALQFNFTKVDDETLLVDWSRISTRNDLRFDGLDELALAGTDELRLVDD